MVGKTSFAAWWSSAAAGAGRRSVTSRTAFLLLPVGHDHRARAAAKGLDDLVTAGSAGVVVITSFAMLVASAVVEVGGDFSLGILLGMEGKTIDDVADERGVAFLVGNLLGAASDGVVVIALEGIHVSTVVVEGSDGVGGENGTGGCGRVEVDAVEGNRDSAAGEAGGLVVDDGVDGDGVDRLGINFQIGGGFYAVVLILRVDIGTGGEKEGFFGVGDFDRAVVIDEIPFVVFVELSEVLDEVTINIDELASKKPLASEALVVGDGSGAPGAHGVFDRLGFDGDDPAENFAAVGELGLLLLDFSSEVFLEEVGGVEDGFRLSVVVIFVLVGGERGSQGEGAE